MYYIKPFVEWCDEEKYIIRGNYDPYTDESLPKGPLKLFPFQRDILGHVFTLDEAIGTFPYTTVVYSTIKKSGKTTLGGAVTQWFGEEVPAGSELFCLANDFEHAQGRAFADIAFSVRENGLAIPTKSKVEFQNGTFIQALAQEYKSAAGSRHCFTLWDELWGYMDLNSLNTQVYTKSGWKSRDELFIGLEVATWNDGVWEWQPIKNIFDHYRDKLWKLNHRRASMELGASHRVLGKFKSSGRTTFGNWEFRRADEAAQAYEGLVPVAADWNGPTPETLYGIDAKVWARLLGFYIAEGSFSERRVAISQDKTKHPAEWAEIESLLDEAGLDYYAHEWGFRLAQGQQILDEFSKLGKSHEKHIPDEYKMLGPEILSELLAGYLAGDGWEAGNGYQCCTVSDKLADDLMEVGIKCGWAVRYMGTNVPKTGRPVHRLSFSKGNICYHRRNWEEIEHHGPTFCLEVENKSFLARTDGNVFWTGNSDSSRRLWAEMTPIKIPGVPHSLRMIVTYAGFEGESELLWDLYENIVLGGEPVEELSHITKKNGDPVCWKKGRMFAYWDTEPRVPWQTEDYYMEQRATLRPHEYLRLHENRWVTTHEQFIPIEWYDEACNRHPMSLELDFKNERRRIPVVIGVDAGVARDSTAIVGVQYNYETGNIDQAFHKIRTPTPNERVDLETAVEQYILSISEQFRISAVVYDPRHLVRSMQRLSKAGINCVEYTQTLGNMVAASEVLYDLLRTQRLGCYPDETAREHIRFAVAEEKGAGFRIVKPGRESRHHVDYAIALAMACHEAVKNHGVDVSKPIRIEHPDGDVSMWKKKTVGPEDDKLPPALRDGNELVAPPGGWRT